MKKIILAIFIAAVSSICYAQRIKIHQGNNINSFLLSNVDSVTHDGNESVTVYYDSQPFSFSVNNVDSLSINSERLECYNIIPEQLNGWDEGIFCMSNDGEDFYIVAKTNTDENEERTVTICINSFANDVLEKTINFIFDEEGNLREIVTAGYQFKAQIYFDIFVFTVYKDGECVGGFNVPCDVINENRNITNYNSRRISYRNPIFNSKGKISWPNIKDFAGKAAGILKPVGDALGTAVNLDEGKYGEILLDFVIGGLISLADLPIVAAIIAEQGIKGLLKYFYEQDKIRLLGDAQIEITSVKRTSETTITVEGTISNISSIPSTVMVGSMSDGYIDEIPNKVYWGIAEGKSGQPGMHLNDNSSGTMKISGDKFSYIFYIDRVPGQVLYFRPFLAPEVTMQSIYSCIRYGERKEFIDVDVELSNFKQTKCYKENDKYQVQFTIDGSIPGLFQELSGWGFDVKTKSESYWLRFNAKEKPNDYYPPIKKPFTCDITIADKDIIDYGTERIAEITITPYVSYWNRLPSATFLDEKIYRITLKDNPPLKFKELKQDYTTYADGNLTASMKAVIEVDSEYNNGDLSTYKSYGVYVKNNITGREDYYSVQENGGMEFYITLDIPGDEFETDYSSFTATCDKLLFATYTIDKEGNISRYDEQEPKIVYDEKPTAKTGNYVSITSTSAVVKSKYEYCTFWNATCGIEYTNNDKTETLIVFPNNEDEQEINLTELTPNTTYKYRAFYEVKGKKEYGEYKSFKTEENLLCPDSNHPHWIDLGLPSGTLWRCCNEGASTPEAYGGYYQFGQVSSAPTLEQIKELVSNCTFQWTTQNGINGGKFTGPNGGTIFLPAAGDYFWGGELYYVGSYGDYWSSTPYDENCAYELHFSSGDAYSSYGWGGRVDGRSVRPVRKN